ncbi:FAD-dependent oxidoreductase [Marinomonas mediterranea]|jgi:2-polyprenyl-6-methoxyphenol hydroxylase and related FAD-dependent oxidoreductases|uniref:FAD-dependent pyridine nucleotide-disulfide oxidoreductase n=1 Tax=Marinomonas mediterranea (strain ATCC 700492 / JCM 21426 / NBRC 103028 / MMB-1) TaxID=717774 RepID=F2K4S1_MARM1|nr:FAD-dependent oxidoreductase [Marinomonas mediterranea]ADZ91464.1 FAD-dependent pyridine nucleotide-disulfide oxidoreductase [Marinomonas mediterranea MMB-1]WCN09431.1 NAD(P)-binding protein [Marinomonas mediterranea]WCN17573.1 NAD(P)-binding protein [Marinomonas mediterranea MMB-1]
MAAVNKVLVIGGGFSGMAAAIRMSRNGFDVDLVEIDPDWCELGAGITINGVSMRALEILGLYDEVVKQGCVTDTIGMYLSDGQLLTNLPTPSPAGSNVGGCGGIFRPTLARIMSNATLEAGVNVRLGCTYNNITQTEDGAEVSFTDGTTSQYDLVVGADGVHSKLRQEFFPEVSDPEYVGQGVWRAIMPRPEEIDRVHMWLGQHLKLGVNPVSDSLMYMFITEDRPKKEHIDKSTWPKVFADLMSEFTDPIVQSLIPRAYDERASIDYRPLANLLVKMPWNRGRLVLIGDTVAATTPHLASGAGIGIESAIVLADELAGNEDLDNAFARFHERRWERCRMVVENSARLCDIEIHGGDKEEHSAIMRESLIALSQPI